MPTSGRFFDGGNSKYCAESARNILVNTYSWTIADGGKDSDVNCRITFDTTIPALASSYTYTVGMAIPTLTLPPATGGDSTLNYTLTPPESIPDGLSFDPSMRTLFGTPNTITTAATLTYAVTDSAATPRTASLTFMITVINMPAINFKRDKYDISEGTVGTITLVADQPPVVEARIRLTTTRSETVANNEYRLSPAIVIFEPGQSTASFEVKIFDDDVVRSTRELRLSFDPLNNSATRGTVSETVISIGNNDVPAISFERDEYDISEGTVSTITLVADQPPVVETRIRLTAIRSETVANNEYRLSPVIVVFEPGQSTASFEVKIFNDDVVRSTRELRLSFDPLNNSATRGTVSETVISIGNNDVPIISFEQDEYIIFEGTTDTVTLVADQLPVVEARIKLTILSGTVEDDKYRLSTTIIVFNPDQSEASFEVSIIDDNNLEARRELRLSIDPLNNSTTRGTVSETVIRVNDSMAPIASLELVEGDVRLEEGESATLRVKLDRTFEQDTSIRIVTAGTATTADYTIAVNRVMLSAGSTYKETTLLAEIDDALEPDENNHINA